MEHYPDWLGRELLAGELPWADAVPGSLPVFLERYPLQDAQWIGLYAEAGQCATMLLRWNGAGDGAILAVRFESLERCEVRLRARALSTVVSGATNRAADWHRTQLTDRKGGEATLVHSPAIRILALSESRQPLPLLVPAETV